MFKISRKININFFSSIKTNNNIINKTVYVKNFSTKFKNYYDPIKFDDHYPVMWRNILEILENNTFSDIVDTNNKLIGDFTFGTGNHSKLILENFDNSLILGIDIDKDMINLGEKKLEKFITEKRLALINDTYVSLDQIKIYNHFNFKKLNSNDKKFDFMLLDLGYNSLQIDSPVKGLSFKYREADLDMRYDPENENKSRASDILNHCSELELMEIFKNFAEEKYYEYLVKKILEFRDKRIFYTVQDFIDVIDDAFRSKAIEKFDCYTRLFQALRIAVNYETLNIQRFLVLFFRYIEVGGLLAIISFNSLEDRYIKKFFSDFEKINLGKNLFTKAVKPSVLELEENSRSRSAILRVFRFNPTEG